MMNEVQNFSREQLPAEINRGAVAIESERAIAEAQGQMALAKRFPRDLSRAHAELMDCCQQMALANVAFYSVPRAGGSVTGPSIRLAEEIARVSGNIEYGHRELSRDDGKSEVEVYAWDKQTNVRSIRQITVKHVIDTKHGPKKCTQQREIDDLIANKASKQLRGRILAIVPKWLVEAAIEQCRVTLAGGGGETISSRIRRMVSAFAPYGVTPERLEKHLGHHVGETTADEITDLTAVFNSIRDGARVSDFFHFESDTESITADVDPLAGLRESADPEPEKKAKKQATKKEPAPEPEPENEDDF